MSKLPYLVGEINAALEVYMSGRTGQQYNRAAFVLCDDCAELASKLFVLTDNPTWSDQNPAGGYKGFRTVLREVAGVIQAKRPTVHATVDVIRSRMESRRDRRNNIFHSTTLLDLNFHARDCVEAFCDLLDYGKLLFPPRPCHTELSDGKPPLPPQGTWKRAKPCSVSTARPTATPASAPR